MHNNTFRNLTQAFEMFLLLLLARALSSRLTFFYFYLVVVYSAFNNCDNRLRYILLTRLGGTCFLISSPIASFASLRMRTVNTAATRCEAMRCDAMPPVRQRQRQHDNENENDKRRQRSTTTTQIHDLFSTKAPGHSFVALATFAIALHDSDPSAFARVAHFRLCRTVESFGFPCVCVCVSLVSGPTLAADSISKARTAGKGQSIRVLVVKSKSRLGCQSVEAKW